MIHSANLQPLTPAPDISTPPETHTTQRRRSPAAISRSGLSPQHFDQLRRPLGSHEFGSIKHHDAKQLRYRRRLLLHRLLHRLGLTSSPRVPRQAQPGNVFNDMRQSCLMEATGLLRPARMCRHTLFTAAIRSSACCCSQSTCCAVIVPPISANTCSFRLPRANNSDTQDRRTHHPTGWLHDTTCCCPTDDDYWQSFLLPARKISPEAYQFNCWFCETLRC